MIYAGSFFLCVFGLGLEGRAQLSSFYSKVPRLGPKFGPLPLLSCLYDSYDVKRMGLCWYKVYHGQLRSTSSGKPKRRIIESPYRMLCPPFVWPTMRSTDCRSWAMVNISGKPKRYGCDVWTLVGSHV